MQSKIRKPIGILLLGILVTILFHNHAKAQISQIHFGSTNTALNGLTITWQNSILGDSIRWGYSMQAEFLSIAPISRSYKNNYLADFAFPELIPDTTLYYSLFDASSQTWSAFYQFKTSHPNKVPFSFTAMGDSRSNMVDWQTLSDNVIPSDFTLFMGDIISNGSNIPEWDSWFNYGKKFLQHNLVYHSLGNHDVGALDSTSNYTNLFVLPVAQPNNELYYSFNYGNAVFICLNSEKPAETVQYNWLLKTLETNKATKWKIIWFHKPFFTSPVHGHDMDAYQGTWWKAFDDYGVDLIFNGHTHNYQRTVPININVSIDSAVADYGNCPLSGRCQIVTGAAGAPLYGVGTGWFIESTYSGLHFVNVQVYDDSIQIKTLTPNHQVIDSFSLVKNFKPSIEYSERMVCSGNQLTLTGVGAQTYQWKPEIENGIAFEPIQSEKYTLTASNKNGCSDTLSIDIVVLPIFTFNDTLTICEGDSVLWHQQFYKNEGVYSTTYQSVNQCDSIYLLNLVINRRPDDFEIMGDTNVLIGSEVFYQVPYNPLFNYYWEIKGGAIIDKIFNNVVKICWDSTERGEIIAYVIDENGCLSNKIIKHIYIETPLLSQKALENYPFLSPNPAQNTLAVNINQPFTLHIYTMQGVEVLITNKSIIDISSLKSGVYLVLCKTEGNETMHFDKVIKN